MKQSAGQQDQIVWGDQLSSKSPGGGRRVQSWIDFRPLFNPFSKFLSASVTVMSHVSTTATVRYKPFRSSTISLWRFDHHILYEQTLAIVQEYFLELTYEACERCPVGSVSVLMASHFPDRLSRDQTIQLNRRAVSQIVKTLHQVPTTPISGNRCLRLIATLLIPSSPVQSIYTWSFLCSSSSR